MLTISQLARFVGVTVRTVRHYHARGLLPEPERDASGYRRYDASAAVALIQIRTLADAGVPLSRVSALLTADPDEFAASVDQVDRELRAKVRTLETHRKRIRRLAAGDSLVLPDEVVAYLGRLRELGISERIITMERDGWLLLAVHCPDLLQPWVAEKRLALDDPAFSELYVRFDRAFDWEPDDPRLETIADACATYLDGAGEEHRLAYTESADVRLDATISALFSSYAQAVSPSWERLGELVAERSLRPER